MSYPRFLAADRTSSRRLLGRLISPGVSLRNVACGFRVLQREASAFDEIGGKCRVNAVTEITHISRRPSAPVGEVQNDSGPGVEPAVAVSKSFYQGHPHRP